MFGKDKTVMITPAEALPGRDAPMVISGRHVALGTPLTGPWPAGHEVLYVGMGCFWGTERIFWQIPGVYSTAAGYMGGWTPNPTYLDTCSAQTGHAETVRVVYDPTAVDVTTLLAAFWENHDPTTPNRQGNDVGTHYRSCIFTTTGAQLEAARASSENYQALLTADGFGTISTEILPADQAGNGQFYYAEDYHQGYLYKNPSGYCNHGFCQVAYEERPAATAV